MKGFFFHDDLRCKEKSLWGFSDFPISSIQQKVVLIKRNLFSLLSVIKKSTWDTSEKKSQEANLPQQPKRNLFQQISVLVNFGHSRALKRESSGVSINMKPFKNKPEIERDEKTLWNLTLTQIITRIRRFFPSLWVFTGKLSQSLRRNIALINNTFRLCHWFSSRLYSSYLCLSN